ncbi:MAG: hypothetical protein ABGW84_11265 [Sphingomonadaceae bacterium]
MSVDFAVFDPTAAPSEPRAFRSWFETQMDLIEESVFEPSELAEKLRSWYDAMIAEFPDITRATPSSNKCIEYSFTPSFIYCSMPTPFAEKAEALSNSLVQAQGIGKYLPMFDDGQNDKCIIYPDSPSAGLN